MNATVAPPSAAWAGRARGEQEAVRGFSGSRGSFIPLTSYGQGSVKKARVPTGVCFRWEQRSRAHLGEGSWPVHGRCPVTV